MRIALFLCLLSLFIGQHKVSSSAAACDASSPSCRDDATASVDIARGGGSVGIAATFNDNGIDNKTRDVILRFLENSTKENPSFHIHGWRWHFMALVRDSKRLERLAKNLLSNNSKDDSDGEADLAALEQAADYVINFNMAGLFRIQSQRSAKFLREHLCDEDSSIGLAETDAFRKVADKLDEYRVQSENAGKLLYEQAKKASTSSSKSNQQKQQFLSDVAKSTTKLFNQLSTMRNLHESLIVPALSHVVPTKIQKSFNNKVLLSLGILESRLHLVGMHDAVWESGMDVEKKMFDSEIPYVARVMIERWRQSLYLPKAGALEYGVTTI